ncbi:YrrS family protein [Amphibacillus jilinensis]|uniref:YrrS family protein n=1 Tax=Amphibacillus jilinensis TaxID=1216008 RepID=UPI00036A5BBF|nr:YrrS family protein [Amphibacillus jilinensis]
MVNEEQSYSRLDRFEKKRKNTKWLSIFIGIGTILIIVFIMILAFSNREDTDLVNEPEDDSGEVERSEPEGEGDDDSSDQQPNDNNNFENETEPSNEEDELYDTEIEVIDHVEDDNVIYAYTSSWEPIDTQQEEPHQITWDQSSQDWREMMQAAELATGVGIEEMYYLWVSGDGSQSVIATFSNARMDEHFRVYITWIEYQGWQPERVDLLHRHDQMHRFNADEED